MTNRIFETPLRQEVEEAFFGLKKEKSCFLEKRVVISLFFFFLLKRRDKLDFTEMVFDWLTVLITWSYNWRNKTYWESSSTVHVSGLSSVVRESSSDQGWGIGKCTWEGQDKGCLGPFPGPSNHPCTIPCNSVHLRLKGSFHLGLVTKDLNTRIYEDFNYCYTLHNLRFKRNLVNI